MLEHLGISILLDGHNANNDFIKGEIEIVDINDKIKLKGSFELFDKRR
jgi:hypothetical protein